MAKRQKRVKLSKAQKFENELNRWLSKKDSAIALLCKAMENLKRLERTGRRLQKAALNPPPAPEPEPELPTSPTFERHAGEPAVPIVTKPKRQRKPDPTTQLGVLGPAPDVEAIAMADEGAAQVSRAARMQALGFRKTSKRGNKKVG